MSANVILLVVGAILLLAAIFKKLPEKLPFLESKDPLNLDPKLRIPTAGLGIIFLVLGVFLTFYDPSQQASISATMTAQAQANNMIGTISAAYVELTVSAIRHVETQIAVATTPFTTIASPPRTQTQLPTNTPYPPSNFSTPTYAQQVTKNTASATFTELPSPFPSASSSSTQTPDYQQTAISILVMTDTAVAATIATNTPFSPGPTIPPGKFVADGFDSPVGTATERASNKIWPGNWIAALGYHMRYGLDIPAYETGTTLILTDSDTTAHQPIFAPASGTVTFAGKVTGGIGQGNIIIIRHDPLAITGQVVYTRFSNIEGLLVKPGDRVTRGQQIADIGPDIARSPYYFLRFEISPTDILFRSPGSWYGRDLSALEANFVDPQQFILASRPHLQAPGEKST